ncbi:MAG: hypothetical protein H6Q29_113 [Bacteroidetes bacterium]|nr:hypothetical protein [Bacteroidota bacterium]
MKRAVLIALALGIIGVQQSTAQFSIGLLGGYGFKDGYKIGFGARAGYSASILYVGGIAMVHTGQEDNVTSAAQSIDVKTNASYYGAELGVNLGTLRPSLILGAVNLKVDAGQEQSEAKFLLGPGLTVFIPLSENLFIGGDARLLVVSKDDALDADSIGDIESTWDNPSGTLVALYATIGYTF